MTHLVRFNIVGALGLALQLGVLALLACAGWPVSIATLVAVEIAVLHNFAWHERWTWMGRREGTRARRLTRFHMTNGAISLAGNAVITAALHAAGVPVTAANALAVVACAGANFAAAHLLVWPHVPAKTAGRAAPARLLC
jgi:putative flippase GtrA